MLHTTKQAARVRRQAAELLCRYLGGDISLVDEVCRLRGFQEELAVQAPDDPRRAFGEAVESTPSGEYLSGDRAQSKDLETFALLPVKNVRLNSVAIGESVHCCVL